MGETGAIDKTRVAIMGIIVENTDSVEQLNRIKIFIADREAACVFRRRHFCYYSGAAATAEESRFTMEEAS
jgi:hypothetical protein